MNLKKVLTADLICTALQGESKQTIIEELLDLLVAKGQVRDRKTALKALLEREAKMSTGMQHGLALPHAKTDAVDRLVGAIGIRREGIDFESIDGEPSTIFILTLSPLSRTGPHIQFLAEIGRLLEEEPLRDRIRNAKTAEDVLAVINS
ncbi:MAG: PTS sugar transporter subunit IIA [Kiritimatiellia bacterium]|nr:PTS sugar transporter subunit IIA [Kiritimatiellia bacterium]